jgi:hypothetical protein
VAPWCGPDGCLRDGDDCCRVGLERGSNGRSPALSRPLIRPSTRIPAGGRHKINALANPNEASCNCADQLRLVDQTFSNGPLGYVVAGARLIRSRHAPWSTVYLPRDSAIRPSRCSGSPLQPLHTRLHHTVPTGGDRISGLCQSRFESYSPSHRYSDEMGISRIGPGRQRERTAHKRTHRNRHSRNLKARQFGNGLLIPLATWGRNRIGFPSLLGGSGNA